MQPYFSQKYTTQICLIKLESSKFLSWTFSDPFSHYVRIWIYKFYKFNKPSNFTETQICFKLDLD